jgi:tRNA threonylcarbamoyladenosine biosynthesis protein TsaE
VTTRVVRSADDMRRLGRDLARALHQGDVLVLAGPVGAGKTTLTQGIAAGLGVTDQVTSPTFVIAREYQAPKARLVHVDAYRVGSSLELDDLDLQTHDAIVVIEWGSPVAHVLADDPYVIEIETRGQSDERNLRIDPRFTDIPA